MSSIYDKIRELISENARNQKWARESHPFDTSIKLDGVEVSVGKYTYGAGNICLNHHKKSPPLKIGRFCSIGGNVSVFTGAYHRSDWFTTYPFGTLHQNMFGHDIPSGFPHSKGGVTIGNDVWIGNSATIMSGVDIGDGAVIASNAHVISNVAPYEIVGGNPAKHLKFRFDQFIIEKLLQIKWWDLDDKIIMRIHKKLTVSANLENLNEFLQDISGDANTDAKTNSQ